MSWFTEINFEDNWFKDNVKRIYDVGIKEFFAFELEDGSGLLEFKVRAKLDFKKKKLSFKLVYDEEQGNEKARTSCS